MQDSTHGYIVVPMGTETEQKHTPDHAEEDQLAPLEKKLLGLEAEVRALQQLIALQKDLLTKLHAQEEKTASQLSSVKLEKKQIMLEQKAKLAQDMNTAEQLELWTDMDDLFGNPFTIQERKNREFLFETAFEEGKIPFLLEQLYDRFNIDQRQTFMGSPASQVFTILEQYYDLSLIPEDFVKNTDPSAFWQTIARKVEAGDFPLKTKL